jgi:metallo-beta-lactamase family protein
MKNIHYISKVEESKRLNKDKQSMIIISASGMCEAGRILHHLKNNIEDKKNVVIIVGYMAENTLGKKLVDKLPVVKIFGEEYKLKSEVGVINAFSAHADKHELLDYINKNNTSIKDIFIVHGDKDQSKRFSKMLTEKGHKNHLPKKDEEITLS